MLFFDNIIIKISDYGIRALIYVYTYMRVGVRAFVCV